MSLDCDFGSEEEKNTLIMCEIFNMKLKEK
jgi:hypothetical protein